MIRHVAHFTWTEGMTEAMEEQFAAELTALGSTLPGLRAYRAGPDVGIKEGNFDFAVVADFEDVDSYLGYRDNAENQDIIRRAAALSRGRQRRRPLGEAYGRPTPGLVRQNASSASSIGSSEVASAISRSAARRGSTVAAKNVAAATLP